MNYEINYQKTNFFFGWTIKHFEFLVARSLDWVYEVGRGEI